MRVCSHNSAKSVSPISLDVRAIATGTGTVYVGGSCAQAGGKLSNHLALWANYLLSLPLIMR